VDGFLTAGLKSSDRRGWRNPALFFPLRGESIHFSLRMNIVILGWNPVSEAGVTDTLRIFIAVELTLEVRRRLTQMRTELESRLPPGLVRWVQIDGIHITVKFLGDVPANRIAEIRDVMNQAAAGRRPFSLTMGGAGCFPNTTRPRVIWAGVNPAADLQEVQQRLEEDLGGIGFAREKRAFAPHLTLGRVRDEVAVDDLRKIGMAVESISAGPGADMQVAALTLFRSILRPAGAEYSVLHQTPFNG
jgi:2'-5' RNA ligase